MARLINGGEFGELRGSLGNNVFTKTAAGSIMRRRAIPVNRNTVAQVAARARFTTVNQRWTGLDPALKAAWDNFAQNGFAPAKYSHTTAVGASHRGRQAFISLNSILSAAAQARSLDGDNEIVFDEDASAITTGTITDGDAPPPPATPLPGTIAGAEVSILGEGGLIDLASGQIQVQFTNNTPYAAGAGSGILVYSSEALPYVGARPRSPKLMLLSAQYPLVSYTPAAPAGTGIETTLISRNLSVSSDHANGLGANEIRMLTIYAFDQYGQAQKLGSQYTTTQE